MHPITRIFGEGLYSTPFRQERGVVIAEVQLFRRADHMEEYVREMDFCFSFFLVQLAQMRNEPYCIQSQHNAYWYSC